MRSRLAAVLATALLAAPVFIAPLDLGSLAFADAIPMPEELTAEQKLLIGVWQEEKPILPIGLGHSFSLRTLAFGNDSVTILDFGGIAPSSMFDTSATKGKWTAMRKDKTTLIVTLDQGEGRGTTLTLVFDGKDAFTLTDGENSRYPESRFTRVAASRSQAD